MSASILQEAEVGIKAADKNELSQKLVAAYSEQKAVINQISAAQWNCQGPRAAELAQILSAAAPEAYYQQAQSQSLQSQTIVPFPPSQQIAERISVLGRRVPSDYNELYEYSKIEDPQAQDTSKNAKSIAKACETFAQTARQTISIAKQADDAVTIKILAAQLQAAERLAIKLRRFD